VSRGSNSGLLYFPCSMPITSKEKATNHQQESSAGEDVTGSGGEKSTSRSGSNLTDKVRICDAAHGDILVYSCTLCYLLSCEQCSYSQGSARLPCFYGDGENNVER